VIGWKAICEKAQWVRVLLIEWTIRPGREKSPSGEYGLRKETLSRRGYRRGFDWGEG
jgi:hypothetical protein